MFATPPAFYYLVKGEDWNGDTVGGLVDEGIAAAAQAGDLPLPGPTWMLCTVWDGIQYGASDSTPCTADDTFVFTAYDQLQNAVGAGLFDDTGIDSAMFDNEPWSITPANEQANAPTWITKAAALARSAGVRLIATGQGNGDDAAYWRAATKAGVYMVAVQSQGYLLAHWESIVGSAVTLIRAVRSVDHTDTLIMVGLATNTGAPVWGVSYLQAATAYAERLRITRFWLNAANHGRTNACTESDGGPGCPLIGARFLANP